MSFTKNGLSVSYKLTDFFPGSLVSPNRLPNYIYTLAGNGTTTATDNVVATSSGINLPYGVAVDASGNVYISDFTNNRVRMVPATSGTYFGQAMTANYIYTIAGILSYTQENVPAITVPFNTPSQMTLDALGNIYITDSGTRLVRMIPKTSGTYFGKTMIANFIYTIEGNGTTTVVQNVVATSSGNNAMKGIELDSLGNVYIGNNFTVRMVPKLSGTYFGLTMTANYIYTIAGNGTTTVDNVVATSSTMRSGNDIAVDSLDNIYTVDTAELGVIRMVPKTSGTYFGQAMSANYIYTIAGLKLFPLENVLATNVGLYPGNSVTSIDASGNIYIGDYGYAGGTTNNTTVRMVPATSGTYFGKTMTANYIYTIAGNGTDTINDNVLATSSGLLGVAALAIDASGNVYIGGRSNVSVRMVPKTSGTYFGKTMTANYIYTIAGTGGTANLKENVVATSSGINIIYGVAVDASGNLYIPDYANNKIRMVPVTSGTYFGLTMTANYIYTIAGNATTTLVENVVATSSGLNLPYGVAVDASGNVYIVDNNNYRIRMVPKVSGTYFGKTMTANYIYTIAGNGGTTATDYVVATSSGINNPGGVAVDASGNLYIQDNGNNRIRMVPVTSGTYFGLTMTANYIYTIAGNATTTSTDYVVATSSGINNQYVYGNGVTVDAAGNLYITDGTVSSNVKIRMVPKTSGTYFGQAMNATYIYTIAGLNPNAENLIATNVPLNAPQKIKIDASGNLYIADTGNYRIRMVPATSGTYFGKTMTASYIYTIAGTSTGTATVVENVAAISSGLYNPYGVAIDAEGNLYIADYNNYRIRMVPKISGTYFGLTMTANYIYTIAGNGTTAETDNVVAKSSGINYPQVVKIDASGNVCILSNNGKKVRMVPKVSGTYFGIAMTANYIYTIAGNVAVVSTAAVENVVATSSGLYNPNGLAVDAAGNVYIADYNNNRIRMVPKTSGTYFGLTMTANYIYTIAGNGGSTISEKVVATSSGLANPYGVAIDAAGNVYIADQNNRIIRIVPATSGTYFGKTMTANYIYTIAGDGGFTLVENVVATSSGMNYVMGVAVDASGNLYIPDYNNYRIRMVPVVSGTYFGLTMTANYIYTIAGNGTTTVAENVVATSSGINNPRGLAVDAAGNVYMTDSNNLRTRMVPKTSGTYFGLTMTANYIYTIAGNGTTTSTDYVVATSSGINLAYGLALDAAGNVYIADYANNRLRVVIRYDTPTAPNATIATLGYIYTIAGNGVAPENVVATNATLSTPYGVTVDAAGNIYLAESGNNRIRMVPKVSGTYFGIAMTANYIYTIAGNGGTAATDYVVATSSGLSSPNGLALDAAVNLYLTDRGNFRIRMVPKISGTYFGKTMTANYIYTIAGNGGTALVENVVATSSGINQAYGVAVDPSGNLYIPNYNNYRIRMVPVVSGTYFGLTMTANYIYTIAGNSTTTLVENVVATSSGINNPNGVAVDASGNVYILDSNNNRIRMVPATSGTYFGLTMTANYIYTIAGNGTDTINDNVLATSSGLSVPSGIKIDASGNLYTSDFNNKRIRMVPKISGTYFGLTMTENYIYTIAGNGGTTATDYVVATSSGINYPYEVTVDASGNLYIADYNNNRIRMVPKISGTYFSLQMIANYIYTIAGLIISNNVVAKSAGINNPFGVTVDASGNLYIPDYNNCGIRMVPKISGTYFGQTMTANNIYTIAGNATTTAVENVVATSSGLYNPGGVAVDAAGNLYIADTNNKIIRMVPKISGTYFGKTMTANNIYTIAGTGGSTIVVENVVATSSGVWSPNGITVDAAGNLYIADTNNKIIRMVPKISGTYFGKTMTANYIYTIAGNGTTTTLVENVVATSSGLYNQNGLAVDASGNVYIPDQTNNRIRMVPKISGTYFGKTMTANYIYTIAGNGTTIAVQNVVATSSGLFSPSGMAIDAEGNLYIADFYNYRIRMVPKLSGTYFGLTMTANYIYTIAGNGTTTAVENVVATSSGIYNPNGVAVDAAGNLYIADTLNNRIRIILKNNSILTNIKTNTISIKLPNFIYTVAGNGTTTATDYVVATSSGFNNPFGLSVDALGNIYISDTNNHIIRMVPIVSGTYFGKTMTANYIHTIAGTGTAGTGSNNISAITSALNAPYGVNVDAVGNVYIVENGTHRVRMVPKVSGTYFGRTMTANYIYSIAGTGTGGTGANNISAITSALNAPYEINVDASGNVYIGEFGTQRVRMVPIVSGTYFGLTMTANYIYTIAGTGTAGTGANNISAITSALNTPFGINVDASGNLYIVDNGNNRLRMVPIVSGTYFGQTMTANYIYTIAGVNTATTTPTDYVLATSSGLNYPYGVELDASGNVYISDVSNKAVRMVPKTSGTYFGLTMTANYIYTIAGNGTTTATDYVIATGSGINYPYGISIDIAGNVYIADKTNNKIRVIPATPKSYNDNTGNQLIFNMANSGYNIKNVDAYNYNNITLIS